MTPLMPTTDSRTAFLHVRERFENRARALFFARLALMAVALIALAVPAFQRALGIPLPLGIYGYLLVLAYHVGSYLWVGKRFARPVIFSTLCLDLLVFLYLVAASGGLKSPLMPTQLVFTMLFALLFPSPLAILPPLLILPVLAKVDQILGIQSLPGDLLLVLWYSALNIGVVYVVVYLESRERAAFGEVLRLQRDRRQTALDDERARIAREIHDSVGAAISGILLQAEYLLSQEVPDSVRVELAELRESADEGMAELRRAVSVMRHEFQLVSSAADYAADFGQRHRLQVRFSTQGLEPELEPEPQLVLFRILQEALANVAKHAAASEVRVQLRFHERAVELEISDDGRGFEPQPAGERRPLDPSAGGVQEQNGLRTGHYGLRHVSERVARLRGTLRLDSAPGQGTTIVVNLPRALPGG